MIGDNEILNILSRLEKQGAVSESTSIEDLEMLMTALLDEVDACEDDLRARLVELLEYHIKAGGSAEITVILCKIIA